MRRAAVSCLGVCAGPGGKGVRWARVPRQGCAVGPVPRSAPKTASGCRRHQRTGPRPETVEKGAWGWGRLVRVQSRAETCGLGHVAVRAGAALQTRRRKRVRFYDACWLATWPGRERTSSAVLERSAATWLGIQLDSSLLVLVAEVSPLLALRPRPIVSVLLCVCSLRARGEGTVRSHARGVCHGRGERCVGAAGHCVLTQPAEVGLLLHLNCCRKGGERTNKV